MNQGRILIVEDETLMREVLRDCLCGKGYRVLEAVDGEQGLKVAISQKPDLILLDIMMPKVDGFSLCQALRRSNNWVPILLLTAKSEVQDRIRGLDGGADDYLTKPFNREELLARVGALLRRANRKTGEIRSVTISGIQLDFESRKAMKGRREIAMTHKEWGMLRLMLEKRGEAISREEFLDAVWEYGTFPTTRTVDRHIAGLRQKLETQPDHPKWITTVHGLGYRFEKDDLEV